jgi:organic radical activating enzyme
VQGYHTNLVVITGGEPLLQDLTFLCTTLIENGFIVQIETAGTVWVPGLPDAVEIVCSPKTGSVHPEIALRCRHWKYIIRAAEVNETDGLPEYSTQIEHHVAPVYRAKQGTIYVQPMDEGVGDGAEATRLNLRATVRSCMEFGYRLSLQVHKIAGVE